MSAAAVAALERALKADDIDTMRFEIMSALGSLKQQPGVKNDAEMFFHVRAKIEAIGGLSAAARVWGVPKQSIDSYLNSKRPVPPKVLRALGMRRIVNFHRYQEV